jgi:hypothetical protein
MNRIQTESKLKADISKSVFEFESTEPSFDNWVNGQINNNFPVSFLLSKLHVQN